MFSQSDKESKSNGVFFVLFFWGVGVGCGGGGVNIMYNFLKWHRYSSRNTNVPNYSEIHA